MNPKDKIAVITGGASGLGRATAEALIEQGAKIAIFDLNEKLGAANGRGLGGRHPRPRGQRGR